MVNRRRPITLLPAVNRTEALERFFGSTVDQLFQPGKTAAISGYIGRVPSYNDPAGDFYKSEPTLARKKYQLESTMVSRGPDGALNDILFYDDLLARLSAEGSLVSQPDRLFQSKYWSWAPPVDIDKINNFQNYYWSSDDVPPVVITMPGIEVPTIARSDGSTRRYKLPPVQPFWRILAMDNRSFGSGYFPGYPIARVDGIINSGFTFVDENTIEFSVAPPKGTTIELFRYGNISDGTRSVFPVPYPATSDTIYHDSDIRVYIEGRETTDFVVNGDHITLNQPPLANSLVTVTIFSSLAKIITGRQYFDIRNLSQEPVDELINGLRIRLLDPETIFYGFDIQPNSAFKWDESRPSDFLVDGVGISIRLTDVNSSYVGIDPQYSVIARDDPSFSYYSRVNRWVQSDALKWFNGISMTRQAKRPICEFISGLAQYNYGSNRAPDVDIVYGISSPFAGLTSEDDFGRSPAAGDTVLFGDVNNPALNNRFFVWPAIDDDADPSTVVMSLLATAHAGDVVKHLDSGFEWRFTGINWIKCATPDTFPLFDLFDNNGISIGDAGEYPESTFAGSRIFNYKVGNGPADTVLGFPVEYDTYGAIMFENDQYSKQYSHRDGVFQGFLYYRQGRDSYGNQWHLASQPLPAVDSSSTLIVPSNLQANPNYDTPKVISRNNWFDHFASIVSNQIGFTGTAYTDNNWQKTTRDLSKGTKIVQSQAPMLKLMMLLSNNRLDLVASIKYSANEYTRYKLKILQKISENMNMGMYTNDMDDDAEIVTILNYITSSKTADFPYFTSTIGGGQFFIPLTPALMGIEPLVYPHSVIENGATYIVGHDGSRAMSIDPLTDRLMLAFERRVFASREIIYAPEKRPMLDEYDLKSGKFRIGAYTRDECNVLEQSEFENWARDNNVDYQTNSGFTLSNPFTWNYGALTDRDGDSVPGNWRGIYKWYFDTETPHLTPWEMLGFAEKPNWWDLTYGPYPYKRTNTNMWHDIEQGIIRNGPREGVDVRFHRPGLMDVLPIDNSGNLLDPVQARIILTAPTQQLANESWIFGDNSPVESLWRRSSSYAFSKAITLFKMRPAQFVEFYWDTDERILVHGNQWVDRFTNDRASNSELTIHGETYDDGTKKFSYGIQFWLVEHIKFMGQSPEFVGTIVRGLDVRLAHKMAGFTTRDRLHIDAESFGRVPDENVEIAIYQSQNPTVDFYSGLVIEQLATSRWRIIGYNSSNPYFVTQPADTNGRKIVIAGGDERVVNRWLPNVYYKVGMFVLHDGFVYEAIKSHTSMSVFEPSFWRQDDNGQTGQQQIVKYTDFTGDIDTVPYATVFSSLQDVVNFIYAYQHNLEAIGFGFTVGVWDEAVTQFINWSKVNWAGGTFLTLSPGARSLTFTASQGYVLALNSPEDAYSVVLNRTGHVMDDRKFKVDRLDNTMTVTATGDDIYGVSLRKCEVEHVLVFDNKTIFGDLIYDPTFNVRLDRLKIHARRTEDWSGRYDAPGFVISNGQIVTNYDKSAEDLRYMFDIELADNTVLRDHARHVIGFENRDYLSKLLLNETQQFELYQGMIQQKGSAGSLSKILRSKAVEGNRDLKFMEEWAFKLAEFGPYQPRSYFELGLSQNDIRRQQQIIRIADDVIPNEPGILSVSAQDSRWVSDPVSFDSLAVSTDAPYGLPTAGYVRLDEATYACVNEVAFSNTVIDKIRSGDILTEGETVWLYTDTYGEWSFKYLTFAAPDYLGNRIIRADNNRSNGEVLGTRLTMQRAHGLALGQKIVVAGMIGDSDVASGVFEVSALGADWFEIDTGDDGPAYDYVSAGIDGPYVFTMLEARFPTLSAASTFAFPSRSVYVDDSGDGSWGVFKNGVLVRKQSNRIDTAKIASVLIYDRNTKISDQGINPEPVTLSRITPIDPISGIIPGAADREIDFKLEYDPASYGGDTTLWTDDYVGRLWWDVSTTWFINPYTDDLLHIDGARYLSELKYRTSNWCRLAPGATVDIYEWTKSYESPEQSSLERHPSGDYVVSSEWSATLNKEVAVYFYWVRNPNTIPATNDRRLDAKSCSQLISDPTSAGIPWMAVVSENMLIISGVRDYLSADSTVVQVQVQLTDDSEAEPHTEWLLMRPEDERSQPPAPLWQKLRDSLVGFDDNLVSTPNTSIINAYRTGIQQNQSMFDADKALAAKKSFINMINYQLARKNFGEDQSVRTILDHDTPINEYLIWTKPVNSSTIEPLPPKALYSTDINGSPLYTTDPAEMEEWMKIYPIGTRILLDNRFSDNPSWAVWEKVANEDKYSIMLAKHYHHTVSTLLDYEVLVRTGGVNNGEFVLVLNNVDFDGIWTVIQHQVESDGLSLMALGSSSEPLYAAVVGRIALYPSVYVSAYGPVSSQPVVKHTYKVVNAQTYRTQDFWERSDWYADGYDSNNPPVISYRNASERNKNEMPIPTNLFVKLADNGSGYWTWTVFDNNQWIVVAQEEGTIKLSDKLVNNTNVFGWANNDYSFNPNTFRNRNGAFELRVMMDAIIGSTLISDFEKNELWFSIINFIHSSHDHVDWAFKTSFMTLKGFNERLVAAPIVKPDNTENILSYVDEVKPYHVTVRDFSRSYALDIDNANITGTDFDKPPYFDGTVQRRLDPENTEDRAIMESGVWRHWLDNMALARQMKVKMKFDRTWWKTGEPQKSAADSIMTYYAPSNSMPPKDLKKLLALDFKGTTLEGDGYNKIIQGDVNSANKANGDTRGFQMRDPRVAENTPEELCRLGAHDILMLKVHDKWGAGAPRHIVKTYDVSKFGTLSTTLSIGILARNVIVFADGMRQIENTNYVVDYVANSVTVSLVRASGTRVQNITIHAIGYGGHTTVLTQKYYVASNTGNTQIQLTGVPSGSYVEVVGNGVPIANTVNYANGNTNTSFSIISGAQYVITAYKGSNDTSTNMRQYKLPYHAAGNAVVYDLNTILGQDKPLNFPYNSSIIVERNGLRLAPPRMYFVENQNRFYFGDDGNDPSTIRIKDDTGSIVAPTVVAESAYSDIEEILNATRPDRFIFWKDHLVLRDADAMTRTYVLTVSGTGEFNINDTTGSLTINTVNEGDDLRVIFWRNDAIMQPRTWSFKALLTGVYRLRTRSKRGCSWLTINGRRLVEDVDYSITPVVAGAWDLNPFDTFEWSDLTEIEISIKNTLIGHETDTVVLTLFEGPQNIPERYWQHASVAPDVLRFRASNDDSIRPLIREPKSWSIAEYDLRFQGGYLSAPLTTSGQTITVHPNAFGVPSQMQVNNVLPVPSRTSPGIIWIEAERIEYLSLTSNSDGSMTLGQLRRGTKGTPISAHKLNEYVIVENSTEINPSAPLADLPVPTITSPVQFLYANASIINKANIVSRDDSLWG